MKKKTKYILTFIALFLILTPCVCAATLTKEYVACHDANVLKGFRVLGYVVMALKILAPIILIITGMYSFFKATLDEDDKATKDAVRLLISKLFVAVGIFFIPTIVNATLKLVSNYDKTNGKYSECMKCITSIKTCNNSINRYK